MKKPISPPPSPALIFTQPWEHDGKTYYPGDSADMLDEGGAALLLAAGAVRATTPPSAAQPVQPLAPKETARDSAND